MTERRYGQYRGLARALDLVGRRWALLIVGALLTGPKRYTELRRALPAIPTNVLSRRLRELERGGVVRRRGPEESAAGAGYELTGHGRGLEEVVLGLSRWGARSAHTGTGAAAHDGRRAGVTGPDGVPV